MSLRLILAMLHDIDSHLERRRAFYEVVTCSHCAACAHRQRRQQLSIIISLRHFKELISQLLHSQLAKHSTSRKNNTAISHNIHPSRYFTTPTTTSEFLLRLSPIRSLVDNELGIIDLRKLADQVVVSFLRNRFIRRESIDVILTWQER